MKSKKLVISNSGGRSSAVMTRLCLTHPKYADYEKVVCFANTGWEHPETLDFVNCCDKYWGFNTVWLEAVVSPVEGEGIRHKVVDYESASRNGEPFKAWVSIYGLPNQVNPKCSDALKRLPQESYLKSLGWGTRNAKNYLTAIGIRADEIDRFSVNAERTGLIYPLAEMGITKAKVNSIMAEQSFDLKLPGDHFGNCMGCWKKSDRKLYTLALQHPEAFKIAAEMEHRYAGVRTSYPDGSPYKCVGDDGLRHMYRGHRDSDDIIREAQEKGRFVHYSDQVQSSIFDELLDLGGACDQGCEIYSDEMEQQ